MAESDHRRCVTAVASDLLELPVAATAATTDASSSHDDEEEEGFTFAAVDPRLPTAGAFTDGRIGPVYPVFGRPRSPPLREEAEDPSTGTATALVPLGQLLLEERGAPSSGEPADDDGGGLELELDGVPAETYCLWSPGASPSPGSQPSSSPARCWKSGSTGSVLRWRQRALVGRSHSDGKEKFVFLDASSEHNGGQGWMSSHGRGGGGSDGRKSTFLPYKRDLVGFFANAGAFRRSYLPF
ncbi:unnamed protein product [Urochloa humidicola]